MIDCLIRGYGEQVNGYYAFPALQALAEARLEELTGLKVSITMYCFIDFSLVA
jgi:hypothetical protein